jgi:glycosyltransferase domain-containing protein
VSAARVTFLVPVRGRLLHIVRLLWHSNRMKIQQRFLIADGSGHPALIALLKRSHQIFPDLDIQHVAYDDDGSLGHFYRRTADAARRVSTPYVMNCGDDDLVLEAGLAPCIEFLDARQDYVCCGGVVAGFSLAAGSSSDSLPVTGRLANLKYPAGRYYQPRDIGHDTALERVTVGYSDYLSSYHNLFRTELLTEIYDEIREQDFSVVHFREAYQAMRTLASGKVKVDSSVVHFLRQRRVGEAAGGDLIRAAFRSPFAVDFERMVTALAPIVSRADGIPSEFAESEIRDAYAEFFRKKAVGSQRKARTFGDHPDEHAHGVKAPITSPEKMFVALGQGGASAAYLKTFRSEFADTVKAIDGGEFSEFVRAHAPELALAHST